MTRLAAPVLLCVLASALGAAHASGELEQYLSAPDPSYSWREVSSGRIGSSEFIEAILTSQTWRGIAWKHQLFVIRPARLDDSSRQAFLYIDGGSWHPQYERGIGQAIPDSAYIFERLAEVLRAPVAVVRQVPFEPLFGRREDALVAYTFDRYLNTGDSDWPLLLPMVKSAARAMDAVQQLARRDWGLTIARFTVTGASKRGWTSWLLAAVDPRVASVAPMVIAMLDMPAQVGLQRKTFGGLSPAIEEYEAIHFPERMSTPLGRELVSIVDPYSYRAELTMPKLILLGTNDPYWPVDALKLYWGGLPQEKRVLYLPNQGHDLRDIERLMGNLSALYRYSAHHRPLPDVTWTFEPSSGQLALAVRADRAPIRVLAWSAISKSRDFTRSHWTSRPCEPSSGGYLCIRRLIDPYTALYAELEFEDPGEPSFSLSTIVCVAQGGDAQQGDAQGSDAARPECLNSR